MEGRQPIRCILEEPGENSWRAEGTRVQRAGHRTSDFLLYSPAGYVHGGGRSSGLRSFAFILFSNGCRSTATSARSVKHVSAPRGCLERSTVLERARAEAVRPCADEPQARAGRSPTP